MVPHREIELLESSSLGGNSQNSRTMPINRHRRIPLTTRVVMIVLLCGLFACAGFAVPLWWGIQGREVLDATQNQDNRMAVTVGQLKTAALRAKLALDEQYASDGGAGILINDMVAEWLASAATDNQLVVATVGQGKTVAKMFYDRLDQLGARHASDLGSYPWVAPENPDEHRSPLSAGQLKTLFRFALSVAGNAVLSKFSGDNQVVMSGQVTSEPLVVWVGSSAGASIEDCAITFALSPSALSLGAQIGLSETSLGQGPVVAVSDGLGLVAVYVQAPLAINSQVEVSATSELGKVDFKVFVQPYDPVLEIVEGGGQFVAPNTVGSEPIVVKLKDGYTGDPLPNETVQWNHSREHSGIPSFKFSLTPQGSSSQQGPFQTVTDAAGECRVWLDASGWSPSYVGLEKIVVTHSFTGMDGAGEIKVVEEVSVGPAGPPTVTWYALTGSAIDALIGTDNVLLSNNPEPDSERRIGVGIRKHGRLLEAQEIKLTVVGGAGWLRSAYVSSPGGMMELSGVTATLPFTIEYLVPAVVTVPHDYGMQMTVRAEAVVDSETVTADLVIETSAGSPPQNHAVGSPQVRIGRVVPNLSYSWTGPVTFTGTSDTTLENYVAQLGRSVALVDDFIVAGGTTRIRSLAVNSSGNIASSSKLKNSPTGAAAGVRTHGGYFVSYDQGSANFFSAGRTSMSIPAFKYDGSHLVRQSIATLEANGHGTVRGLCATPLGFAVVLASNFFPAEGFYNRLEAWNWGTGGDAGVCTNTQVSHEHEIWVSGYSDSSVTSFGQHFAVGRVRPHTEPPWDPIMTVGGLYTDSGTSYQSKYSSLHGHRLLPSSLEFSAAASAVSAKFLAVASVPHGMATSTWTGEVERSCIVTIYSMEGGEWQYHDNLRVFESSEGFDGGEVQLAWDGDRLVVAAYAGNAWVNNVGVGSAINGPVRNSTNGVPAKPAPGSMIERFRVASYLPLDDGRFVMEHLFRDDSTPVPTSNTRPASSAHRQFSLAAASGRVLLGFPTLRRLELYEETALRVPADAPVGTLLASLDTFDTFAQGGRGYVLECDHAALTVSADENTPDRWNVFLASGSASVAETTTYIRAVAAPASGVVVPAVLPRVPLRFSIGGAGDGMVAVPSNLMATRTSASASALSCVDESVNETAFQFQYRQDNQTAWTSLTNVSSTTQSGTGAVVSRNHTGIGTAAIWVDYRVRAVRVAGGVTTYSNFSPVTRCFMKDPLGEASMTDTDGDGVPNEVETLEGTSPSSASSNTLGLGLAPRSPLLELE